MGVIKKFSSLGARFRVGGGLLVPSPAALSSGSLGFFRASRDTPPSTSCRRSDQIANAHQIVWNRSWPLTLPLQSWRNDLRSRRQPDQRCFSCSFSAIRAFTQLFHKSGQQRLAHREVDGTFGCVEVLEFV